MTSPVLLGAVDVLLVEDDPGDVLMTTEAFEHHLGLQLHVVGDGEEALRFLRRTGDFAGAPRPTLIVLDLNLPRRSGLEVLGEINADPRLQTIPVVVLTTSQAEQDIVRSYQLHANAYVIKPFGADQFTDAIRQIDDFFLTLVQRPPVGGGGVVMLIRGGGAAVGRDAEGLGGRNGRLWERLGGWLCAPAPP